ncbi:hypothetical protein C8Q80DRAFT_1122711 [Daedaleopsis nitida]|nr:hypothetical protein C8Q80DRAFT_1122711 [Daedaleopsis nitida]
MAATWRLSFDLLSPALIVEPCSALAAQVLVDAPARLLCYNHEVKDNSPITYSPLSQCYSNVVLDNGDTQYGALMATLDNVLGELSPSSHSPSPKRHTTYIVDVIYYKLFCTPAIVLNTLESARDLLDKRSGLYSDRLRLIPLDKLRPSPSRMRTRSLANNRSGYGTSLPPLRYGDRFRQRRKMMHESIMKSSDVRSPRCINSKPELELAVDPVQICSGVALGDHLAEAAVTAVNEGGTPGSMLSTSSLSAVGDSALCIVRTLLEACKESPSVKELEDIKAMHVDLYGGSGRDGKRVGHDQLPDFGVRQSLLYLNALLEELYRWNRGLPLAIPHCVMVDNRYLGYDISAGYMMMPYIYTDKHAQAKATPSSFILGFGRRICLGQAFADATLFLALANMIATFDTLKPLDGDGREYTPPAAFKPSFTSHSHAELFLALKRPQIPHVQSIWTSSEGQADVIFFGPLFQKISISFLAHMHSLRRPVTAMCVARRSPEESRKEQHIPEEERHSQWDHRADRVDDLDRETDPVLEAAPVLALDALLRERLGHGESIRIWHVVGPPACYLIRDVPMWMIGASVDALRPACASWMLIFWFWECANSTTRAHAAGWASFQITAYSGEIRPSGRTVVASAKERPGPRVRIPPTAYHVVHQ